MQYKTFYHYPQLPMTSDRKPTFSLRSGTKQRIRFFLHQTSKSITLHMVARMDNGYSA